LAFHGLDDCEDPSSDTFPSAQKPKQKLRRRRSRREMMLDILEAVREGAEGPTRIMYKANLSWFICQDLLEQLVKRGSIRPVEGTRKRYELTPKGSDILSWSRRVAEEIGG